MPSGATASSWLRALLETACGACSAAGRGGPAGGGEQGQGAEKRRQRGGQPGAAAPKRVDRSGLPRREEVLAALEPTLFRGSSYGLSVWVMFLLQVYWQRHPARAFEREWEEYGVRLPASTLLGHTEALLGWFEPLEQAIAAHQQQALLVHGDETSWVVHVRAEEGGGRRAAGCGRA